MKGLWLAALAAAQAAPPPVATPGEVVITAPRPDATRALVADLTETRAGRQIARWDRQICPEVLGMDGEDARYVEERIGTIARTVGLRRPRRSCTGNVLIAFTREPDALAQRLVTKHPALMAAADDGMGRSDQRDALLDPTRPIRWFGAGTTIGRDGQVGDAENNRLQLYSASRIITTTREQKFFSFIIVDVARLEQATWQQLADYLAMVALAQPRNGGTYGPDTVLSLFTFADGDARRPTGLTDTDRAFLTSLYGSDAARDVASQRAAIASGLQRKAR